MPGFCRKKESDVLVGVLQKSSLAEVRELLGRMDVSAYDALELRLDACPGFSLAELAGMRFPLPVIFTLRAASEGGLSRMDEAERLLLLEQLAGLEPEYLDVESFVPTAFVAKLQERYPGLSCILSRHDFAKTPEDLDAVLAEMFAGRRVDGVSGKNIYKIACLAQNGLDSLRMLAFCKRAKSRGVHVVGICMGPDGESTRILAPVVHYGLCYCPIEERSAPGQIDSETLRSVYAFRNLNAETAMYGLLGDPVEHSVGHLYHNERNVQSGENAVYVKWRLEQHHVAQALELLQELGVHGLSVTMPLKEKVADTLIACDTAVAAIGAANTLMLQGDGWHGANTDGRGALDNLPGVTGKRVALLGMGGAAKAIIYEILQHDVAELVVYNRTVRELPFARGVRVLPLDEIRSNGLLEYDCIINALPFTLDFPFETIAFNPRSLALDISYGGESPFLAAARAAGCRVFDGSAMFAGQARLQRLFWGCRAV